MTDEQRRTLVKDCTKSGLVILELAFEAMDQDDPDYAALGDVVFRLNALINPNLLEH